MEVLRKNVDSVFLLLLFLLGLFFSLSYGVYWDQGEEIEIVNMNALSYIHKLNAEDSSIGKILIDKETIPIEKSYERDHGAASLLPMTVLCMFDNEFVKNIVWHTYIYVISFTLGIVSLYFLLFKVTGKRVVSIGGSLLLFLSPRVFAEMHYNNKDIVFMCITLFLIYRGYCLYKNINWANVFAFSFAAALCVNCKIVGAYYVCLIGVYIVGAITHNKKWNSAIAIKACVCLGTSLFDYAVLTPAMISKENGGIEFVNYLITNAKSFSRWSGAVLFEGAIYSGDTLPWYYLPKMMLITIPPVVTSFAFIGAFLTIKNCIANLVARKVGKYDEGILYIGYVGLLGFFPLIYAVITGTLVYNGWRHFYFLYAPIMCLVGVALFELDLKVKREYLKAIVISAYFLIMFGGICLNAPNEHSYFNFMAGDDVERKYETDYWGVSAGECFDIILRDSIVETPSLCGLNYSSSIVLWKNEGVIIPRRSKNISVQYTSSMDSDYFVINQVYDTLYPSDEAKYVRENCTRVDTVRSYGNILYEIYRND